MNKNMNYNDDMNENIKDIEILLVELRRINESCMKLAKKLTTHVLPDRKQKLLVVHTLEIEKEETPALVAEWLTMVVLNN